MSLTLVPYIVALVGAAIMFCLPRGKDILVPVAFLPWLAFDTDVGVSLSTSQILFMLLMLRYLTHVDIWRVPKPVTYLLLAFVLSLVMAAITINATPYVPVMAGGPLRNGYGRVFTISVMTACSFIPWILISRFWKEIDPGKLMRVYIWSCAALAAVGVLQYVIWLRTGTDPFPLLMFTGNDRGSGLMHVAGELTLRVSSLGGEPRDLAISLLVALFLLALGRSIGIGTPRRLALAALFLGVIVLTASSSVLITLPFAIAILFAFSQLHAPARRQTVFLVLLVLSFATSGAFYFYALYYDLGLTYFGDDDLRIQIEQADSFLGTLWMRTIGRFQLDDFDHVIMDSFVQWPASMLTGRGLGVIHHYAYQFVPIELTYMQGRLVTPKSGVTFLISNVGLIGMVFVMAFFAMQIPGRELRYRNRSNGLMILRVQAVALSLMLALLLRLVWDLTLVLIPTLWLFAYRFANRPAIPRRLANFRQSYPLPNPVVRPAHPAR